MRNDVKQALETFEINTFLSLKSIEKAEQLLNSDEKVIFIMSTNCDIISSHKITRETYPGVAIITNKRFIFHYKLLFNSLTEIVPLKEVRSINCSRKGTLLVCGHLELNTIAKSYDVLIFQREDLIQKLQHAIENAIYNETHIESSNQNSNILSQIEKLSELKERGIITEDEFQDKKQELLSKL